MKICSNFHESITFGTKQCPFCKERAERAKALDEIVKKVKAFRGSYPVDSD